MYVYTTLFDKVRFSKIMHNGDDVLIDSWRAVLGKLQDQPHQQGLEGGKRVAFLIMRTYEVIHPTTNQLPVLFLDIIKTISNPTRYKSYIERNHTICHIIMHVMFIYSMNTWLHDLSNAWKTEYNIKEEREIYIQQQGKELV